MNILVTGHEGYIGSVLVPILLKHGHKVTGVDTGYYRQQPVPESNFFHSMRKDIRDLELTDLQGHQAIIHLAALSNDPLGNMNADWTYEINYRASLRLAELSKDAGVQRFLFSSSCSVYGLAESEKLVTELFATS
jgi:nucleoside-diphosphate-sugar epimerase